MKMQGVAQYGLRMPELQVENIPQCRRAIQVQLILAAHQMHRRQQPHQPKVMVAMQVANENVLDTVRLHAKTHKLHLRAFAAIDQVKLFVVVDELGSGMAPVHRGGRTTAENEDFKLHSTASPSRSCFSISVEKIKSSAFVVSAITVSTLSSLQRTMSFRMSSFTLVD